MIGQEIALLAAAFCLATAPFPQRPLFGPASVVGCWRHASLVVVGEVTGIEPDFQADEVAINFTVAVERILKGGQTLDAVRLRVRPNSPDWTFPSGLQQGSRVLLFLAGQPPDFVPAFNNSDFTFILRPDIPGERLAGIEGLEIVRQELLWTAFDPDPEAAADAAIQLGFFPVDEATLAVLHERQSAGDARVRVASIGSALRLGDDSAVAAVASAYDDIAGLPPDYHYHPNLTMHLYDALRKLRAPAAIGPLIALLDRPEPTARQAVLEAIGAMGASSALTAVVKAVEDEHPRVRHAAVSALAELGDRSVLPALVKALDDTDRDVRYVAVRSLSRLTGNRGWCPWTTEFYKAEEGYIRRWKDWWREQAE